MFVGFITVLITQLHLRIISLNYTLSRPRQIKIKAKVSAQLSAIKNKFIWRQETN